MPGTPGKKATEEPMTAKTEAPNATKLASFLRKHGSAGNALKASCEPVQVGRIQHRPNSLSSMLGGASFSSSKDQKSTFNSTRT